MAEIAIIVLLSELIYPDHKKLTCAVTRNIFYVEVAQLRSQGIWPC